MTSQRHLGITLALFGFASILIATLAAQPLAAAQEPRLLLESPLTADVRGVGLLLLTVTPPPVQDTLTVARARLARSPGVLRASARIGHDDLIRIRGDFGEFQGYASVVGSEGMDGLRVEAHGGRPKLASVPSGRVTWDRIDEVDKRGRGWRNGALIGGIALGALGGYLFYEGLGEYPKDTTKEKIGDAAVGFCALGTIGAVLGAGVGLLFPTWQRIYVRPEAIGARQTF